MDTNHNPVAQTLIPDTSLAQDRLPESLFDFFVQARKLTYVADFYGVMIPEAPGYKDICCENSIFQYQNCLRAGKKPFHFRGCEVVRIKNPYHNLNTVATYHYSGFYVQTGVDNDVVETTHSILMDILQQNAAKARFGYNLTLHDLSDKFLFRNGVQTHNGGWQDLETIHDLKNNKLTYQFTGLCICT